jgi:hypothetical protein
LGCTETSSNDQNEFAQPQENIQAVDERALHDNEQAERAALLRNVFVIYLVWLSLHTQMTH